MKHIISWLLIVISIFPAVGKNIKPEIAVKDTACHKEIFEYIKQIEASHLKLPKEKVYLHFDNTAYFEGETIWFKAYVVQAANNALSKLSKTLYVELVTEEGNVVKTQKLKIIDGRCSGNILLTDLLHTGFYEIRAYTRYMLNNGSDAIFSRVFPVYEKPVKEDDYSKRRFETKAYSKRVPGPRMNYLKNAKNTISFYPEGGNLVVGLDSRVAFQAFDEKGRDAIVDGCVLKKNGDTLSTFSTSVFGKGSFYLTPTASSNVAKVKFGKKEYTFAFPEAIDKGYVMHVDNTENEYVGIVVNKSTDLKPESLGVALTCRGVLYGYDSFVIGEENAVSLRFPKKMLPSGVSCITLFNDCGLPLAERMVFVSHNSGMKIEAMSDKSEYKPFEKVKMEFGLKDNSDNPVMTEFSVSVRDASTFYNKPYQDNLLTNLLLSSDLRGYVENPGYYFENDGNDKSQDLELLMLTQGWSRYNWNRMVGQDKSIENHPVEKGLYLEGRTISLTFKKAKEDVDVLMFMSYDSLSQHASTKTDNEGRFNFDVADFQGDAKLTLQTKVKNKRREHIISLDRQFCPNFRNFSFAEKTEFSQEYIAEGVKATDEESLTADSLSEVLYAKTPMNKKDHMLKEVVLKDKKDYNRIGEGLANANIAYDIEKEVNDITDKGELPPATLLTFLQEKDPYFSMYIDNQGSTIMKYKGRKIFSVVNNVGLVSGAPTSDNVTFSSMVPDLMMTEVTDIMIDEKEGDVFKYNVWAEGDEVVFFIYTVIKPVEPYGIRNTTFKGYEKAREFFSPQYDKVLLPDDKDYRRTLYWNPDVRTDKDGKATINFYNNGSCKKMNVSAETVTENGMTGVYNK
jgi:hypothetical protein